MVRSPVAVPKWTTIAYREFHDVPRAVVLRYQQQTYYLDCPFDELRDDYAPDYEVYLMPDLSVAELGGSWESLAKRATRRLGSIPVESIRFDETRRRQLDWESLKLLVE